MRMQLSAHLLCHFMLDAPPGMLHREHKWNIHGLE